MPARPRSRSSNGVTLVELLVVLLIVGVLAGVAVILVPVFTKKGDKAACESDKRDLERAIFTYEDRTGSKPASLSDITDDDGAAAAIVGNTLVRDRYTLTYSGGAISSCTAALAAGGAASPSPSPAVDPTITNCAPGKVKQGDSADIRINGTGFDTDASATVSGTGLTVTLKSRTATAVVITVVATSTASPDARTVVVTNAGTGRSVSEPGCLEVQEKK